MLSFLSPSLDLRVLPQLLLVIKILKLKLLLIIIMITITIMIIILARDGRGDGSPEPLLQLGGEILYTTTSWKPLLRMQLCK